MVCSTGVIEGRKLSEEILDRCLGVVKRHHCALGVQPHVVTIMVGEDRASALYLRLRNSACAKADIVTTTKVFPTGVSEVDLLSFIRELNDNPSVHGILVQYPLPKDISEEHVRCAVDAYKDVEGLCPSNLGKTLLGLEDIVPCTPLAVIRMLEYLDVEVKGLHCVIVNHSTVVGRPLAALLMRRDATVTVCNEFTRELESITRQADVLIPATGIAGLIGKDHIKSGCLILDVGIAPNPNGKGIVGDVDVEAVRGIARCLTRVPGGIGPVTIACAVENMVRCFELINDL